jgi:hypothetical protein
MDIDLSLLVYYYALISAHRTMCCAVWNVYFVIKVLVHTDFCQATV